jgi:hypothetical protein
MGVRKGDREGVEAYCTRIVGCDKISRSMIHGSDVSCMSNILDMRLGI